MIPTKKDWFKRASGKRKAVSEQEYEDLWRCIQEWMVKDMAESSNPAYYMAPLGTLYVNLKDARALIKGTENGIIRYEKVLKNYLTMEFNSRNPIVQDPLLRTFNKYMSTDELEKFQNNFKKPF